MIDPLQFIKTIPYFGCLSDNDIAKIKRVCQELTVSAGEQILTEGEGGDKYCIIIEGLVEIIKSYGTGNSSLLSVYGPGEMFGEISLIDDLPISASAIAKTDTTLLAIKEDDFDALIGSSSPICLSIMRSISAMLRKSTDDRVKMLQQANQALDTACGQLKEQVKDYTRTQCELKKDKAHLEEQIQMRTKELLNTHDRLKQEALQRNQALEALENSEKKYRLLVQNANHAIFILQDGRIKFHNPKMSAVCHLLGFDIAHDLFEDHIHPEDRAFFKQPLNSAIGETGAIDTHTFRLMDSHGEKKIWVELTAVSINWENSAATLNCMRDITAQKELENQFREAQKMEAIGALAGGIAHDFNNLLMAIQGNVSLLIMDMSKNSLEYRYLRSIKESIDNGAHLTRQLLGFAQSGKYRTKPECLNTIVQAAVTSFSRKHKTIQIEEILAQDICNVLVDRGQIEQVLLNLFLNALQAMPDGGRIIISTATKTFADKDAQKFSDNEAQKFPVKPGRYAKLTVSDNGSGMDELTRQQVFEPFFTTKPMGEGTGLGLSAAFGIIHNHGGFINFDSIPGEGTTFNILLPATDKHINEPQKVNPSVSTGDETLLLVDDEPAVIRVCRSMLQKLGYTILTASGGRVALEVYRANMHRIDLVILDLVMPDMGGEQVLQHILRIAPQTKIILASGYNMHALFDRSFMQQCRGFIQKPFTLRDLSSSIRKVLDSQ